jgi:hypothetical protein
VQPSNLLRAGGDPTWTTLTVRYLTVKPAPDLT